MSEQTLKAELTNAGYEIFGGYEPPVVEASFGDSVLRSGGFVVVHPIGSHDSEDCRLAWGATEAEALENALTDLGVADGNEVSA